MEENRGAVMTFLVISAAIEWLEQHHEQVKAQKTAKEEARKAAADAELEKKLVGTKVTVENFMNWKRDFDAKRLKDRKDKKSDGQKKLTGKELFLQNSTLNESDLKFTDEMMDENVEFDEALFEDMDGLDIEDEE